MKHISQRNKGKVKMIKDLKYGKANLRQSLIEMTEFVDIGKMYKLKKELYRVEDLEMEEKSQDTQENDEDIQIILSPEEKIALYKREKMNRKMKERLSRFYEKETVVKHRIRRPKASRLLDDFQQQYRH